MSRIPEISFSLPQWTTSLHCSPETLTMYLMYNSSCIITINHSRVSTDRESMTLSRTARPTGIHCIHVTLLNCAIVPPKRHPIRPTIAKKDAFCQVGIVMATLSPSSLTVSQTDTPLREYRKKKKMDGVKSPGEGKVLTNLFIRT